MQDASVDERIAARVRALRGGHKLSLDSLARRSGVSRSMISRIERAESSPTAVLLERLAGALGVPLASLFETPAHGSKGPVSPLARYHDQPLWRDPGSGYLRRIVSPSGVPHPMQIVEVTFPPGKRIAFESGPRERAVYQQVWLLSGAMNITVGDERYKLRKGDCLAMQLNKPTTFHNPARTPARYAVVVASGALGTR